MSEASPPSPAATSQEQTSVPAPRNRQRTALIVLILIMLLGIGLGLRWFIRSQTHIETDNAFIEAPIHPVAPRIPGTVTRVLVRDNQFVKKGQLLVELDPSDYQVALNRAEAELGIARNEASSDHLQVATGKAALQSALAQQRQAHLDLKRGTVLYEKQVIPKEQLERLQTALQVSEARLKQAKENVRKDQAIAGIGAGTTGSAAVRKQLAVLEENRLKLGYTRITAPVDGYITRKGIEVGATVQSGQSLMAVVELAETWIVANYKESQMRHIRPGQQVHFRADAYPGQTFTGKVDSIMAGTGAAFSLLPPENATGNYVKVLQRIPVKITIDPAGNQEKQLRVGMSVIPTIETDRSAAQVLKELL